MPASRAGLVLSATKGKADKPVEIELVGPALDAQHGHRGRKGKLVDSKLRPPFRLSRKTAE
jgi:hypothetical protein